MELAFAIGKHLLGSLAIGYALTQLIVMLSVGMSLATSRVDKISFGPQIPILGVAVAVIMWAFG